MRVMADVECVVRDLFAHYFVRSADFVGGMGCGEWCNRRARRVSDYIAGMTDRYALIERAKYFKTTPELR